MSNWSRGEEKKPNGKLYVAYNQDTGRQVVMGMGKKGMDRYKTFTGTSKPKNKALDHMKEVRNRISKSKSY